MKMENLRLRKGPYRGDVSALCLFSSPPDHRLLLTGTGPHVLLYSILTGRLLSSIDAFDGVRVHGICCGPAMEKEKGPSKLDFPLRLSTVFVHGERRVKVFQMVCSEKDKDPQLQLIQALPRFSHWVMDVRPLLDKEASHAAEPEEVMLLAVGLSNNTICLWDLTNYAFLYRVECSERLLLYSMRLWGDSLDNLHAGVGTIFNEVVVWKLGNQRAAVKDVLTKNLTNYTRVRSSGEAPSEEEVSQEGAFHKSMIPFIAIEDTVDPLQRLSGHEGSIYRLTWSIDGRILVSVSDDRSARVWLSGGKTASSCDAWVGPVTMGPVLYGHGARLWDSHVSEKLLITASEDCTCRIWTTDGKCLATLKGHQGRGIWRCVYDPETNVVVTAGADSAVKIQSLKKWAPKIGLGETDQSIGSHPTSRNYQTDQEVFTITPAWSDTLVEGPRYMDSKAEYVRCLRLSDHCSLYVGTNQGYVYHVQLSQNQKPVWTTLLDNLRAPVVCMDVLVTKKVERSKNYCYADDFPSQDMVVTGDGKGNVNAILITRIETHRQCRWRHTWSAGKERQLLGVFWCKSLEGRYVFTTDPKGAYSLWLLPSCTISNEGRISSRLHRIVDTTNDDGNNEEELSTLVASGTCPYGRVVCLDACPDQQLLVCGDKQGCLTLFYFPKDLLEIRGEGNCRTQCSMDSPFQLQILATFKGAHGISAVTDVSFVTKQSGEQGEIHTTGKDGCVCKFHLENVSYGNSRPQALSCMGIEKVAAVSMLECLQYCIGSAASTDSERKIAVGFTGSDFLLYDTTHKSELMRVTCGGWRRPYSFIIGEMPDIQHALVFVKDQAIQVHRNWMASSLVAESNSESDMTTQSLRGQFHGKEINSVLIFSCPTFTPIEGASKQSVIIATGAEDGTVILSSYMEDTQEHLNFNLVLGDHVGGSAVRSLTLVDKIHHIGEGLEPELDIMEYLGSSSRNTCGKGNTGQFLFSAGAKEVLTCWILDWVPASLDVAASYGGNEETSPSSSSNNERLQGTTLSKAWKLSSEWVSTRMPQRKRASTSVYEKDIGDDILETVKVNGRHIKPVKEEEGTTDRAFNALKMDEDDYRYLAATGFGVWCPKTRNVICFLVTASSNATLNLLSFRLATRSWVEVGTLDYQDAPVLTIEHIVVPFSTSLAGQYDAYIILTGATNGNIVLWDVTSCVLEHLNCDNFDIKEVTPTILRPLTGRGSQGGRRRKTREQLKLAKKSKASDLKTKEASGETSKIEIAVDTSQSRVNTRSDFKGESGVQLPLHDTEDNSETTQSLPSLNFLQELEGAHQSGVNCMSVARLQGFSKSSPSGAEIMFLVISGGDDQALHLTTFILASRRSPTFTDFDGSKGTATVEEENTPMLRCLSRSTIPGAHNSAVKGIWTDGSWVFSTGLDQRLRCWRISPRFLNAQMSLGHSSGEERRDPASMSPLEECMTCVIDTPEAASLHVNSCPQGKYQIAVVGRGLQVINFESQLPTN